MLAAVCSERRQVTAEDGILLTGKVRLHWVAPTHLPGSGRRKQSQKKGKSSGANEQKGKEQPKGTKGKRAEGTPLRPRHATFACIGPWGVDSEATGDRGWRARHMGGRKLQAWRYWLSMSEQPAQFVQRTRTRPACQAAQTLRPWTGRPDRPSQGYQSALLLRAWPGTTIVRSYGSTTTYGSIDQRCA